MSYKTLTNKTVITVPAKLVPLLRPLWGELLALTKGMTWTTARGAWIGADGQIVEEDVARLIVHYGGDWLTSHRIEQEIGKIISALHEHGEEAVLIEHNGGGASLHFKD